ncbi:MAG: cytidylyltransferase domain-containing protein [Paludibacteraceae bacterium]
MKTIAIVPIKLNNERLPNKNIKPFDNGAPLCHYIFETLKQVKDIDEIYVYCSNPKIQEFIPLGVKFLRRSETLDQNTTKINEVLSAFAQDVPADVYVMSHATAPFISPQSIEKGLQAVLQQGFDSAFAVRKIQTFLWKDGKPFNYNLNNIPRTQDLPPIFEETSGFYIYRSEVITELNRRIGDNPYMVEVNAIESCDIDTQEDFDVANAIFKGLKR